MIKIKIETYNKTINMYQKPASPVKKSINNQLEKM